MANLNQIPIDAWLKTIALPQYLPFFANYPGVESILSFTDEDVLRHGIQNPDHRSRIVSSLKLLATKVKQKASSDTGYNEMNRFPAERRRQLQTELDNELKLPSSDIRSYPWFHGTIPRQKSELLVQQRGDFLVRESISQPGLYVLTCNHQGRPLHFVINKFVEGGGRLKVVEYGFDSSRFTSVPALIMTHVSDCLFRHDTNSYTMRSYTNFVSNSSRHTTYSSYNQSMEITSTSGAKITHPVNRTLPLSFQLSGSEGSHTPPQPLFTDNDYEDLHAGLFILPPPMFDDATNQQLDRSAPVAAAGFNNGSLNQTIFKPQLSNSNSSSQSSLGASTPRSLQQIQISCSNESLTNTSRHQTVRNADSPRDILLERVCSVPHMKDSNMNVKASSPSHQRKPQSMSHSNATHVSNMKENRACSDPDIHNSPTHLPNRSREVSRAKGQASHHVVTIRNRELYDEGPDYSDYSEVKRMHGKGFESKSASSLHTQPPSNNKIFRSNQSSGSLLGSADELDGRMRGALQPAGRLQSSGSTPRASRESIDKTTPTATNSTFDIGGEDYDTPSHDLREIHDFTYPAIPKQYVDAFNFKSKLIAAGNKPLDPNCMYKMKSALLQENPKLIAQHITYLDLHLLKVVQTQNLGAGVFSGIEALTLPYGQHFRQAAIERHKSLVFLAAVTILACTDDLLERSQMLKQWIHISLELLRSHGNYFSFMAIIDGISSSPVQRLRMTWSILQRSEPVTMNHWKTKITSAYKSLKETGSYQTNENISIPYVTPVCEMMERDCLDESVWIDDRQDLISLLSHLEMARLFLSQTSDYSKRGQSVLNMFQPRADLRDLFKVELHMRLLYGEKGCTAHIDERANKFSQILKILSMKAEANDDGTSL